MKKTIAITMVLLILLTACQPVPVVDSTTAGSTPSSSSDVPPSSSAVPATSVSVTTPPATSTPKTNPPEPDVTGYSFVYKGTTPFISFDADYSDCTVGYLYWVDKTSGEVTSIMEEQVLESIQEGEYVYYVKEAEPTKIYRTRIGEFLQHETIYESNHGKVSAMLIDTHTIREQLVLQFVADEKKFVVLNLDTGETAILTEQYYIQSAMFDHSCTDTWEEQTDFIFWGKIDENHSVQSYRCFMKTGEIRIEGECAD